MPSTHIRDLLTPEQYNEHLHLVERARKLDAYKRLLTTKITDLANPKSQRAVAARLNISRTRVHQLEKTILHKLRHRHPELKDLIPTP